MARYYTGVGSRNTPANILDLMKDIAHHLQRSGYTLRSGGAKGADSSFENGAGIDKQIFYANDTTPQAEAIAAQFHPAWNRCSEYARKLHGRNSFQVLGPNLNEPSELLICWTPDGCTTHNKRTIKTGGTGTAISIADAYGVKVYNLAVPDVYTKWQTIVGESKQQKEVNVMEGLKYIYTAHYRYPGEDRTDITVKGQDPMGRAFAPTWDIVNGVKNGTITEQEYVDRYLSILHNVPHESWNWLFAQETRTFVCFCAKDAFCHRNILLNCILAQYGDRIKYMGWRS
jgi:hypothetical protein